MENIKLVNTFSFQDKLQISESEDSILHYVFKLQNQLRIDSLIETFDECIRSIHGISGIRYRYPLLAITHQIGVQNTKQCHLHLEANDEFLGDITIFHDQPINSAAIRSIELISSLLTHPLRAIILEKANTLLGCTDQTVGIANAVVVEQMVTREAQLAQRERTPMSIVLINIDRFKRISNPDNFIVRDATLFSVMEVMRSCIRNTDLLFRYKNDTYCLILKGVTPENAYAISERLRSTIYDYKFTNINDKPMRITVSSGIAELLPTDSIESIFSRATNAIQHAKKMGRNQSIVADGTFIS